MGSSHQKFVKTHHIFTCKCKSTDTRENLGNFEFLYFLGILKHAIFYYFREKHDNNHILECTRDGFSFGNT
jgi:hypothetical protein